MTLNKTSKVNRHARENTSIADARNLSLKEIEALQRDLKEANDHLLEAEKVAQKMLTDLVPHFLHASAYQALCEGMQKLLEQASIPVPEKFAGALQVAKELQELDVLRGVVGIVDMWRINTPDAQKLSDAEMLQRAITLFSSSPGDVVGDEVAEKLRSHFAKKIEETVRLVVAVSRTNQGKNGAASKLAKDPRQAAKAGAFKLWKERYAGKHPKLRTNEQFATEVMRLWPVLPSSKVICGWCTVWTKEQKTQPAS
ncbi:MAG: hypothetical protein ABI858_08800 [Pseudoxanthomonas sp.]